MSTSKWSTVSPAYAGFPTAGWTFQGKEPATQEDLDDLIAEMKGPIQAGDYQSLITVVDTRTLVGRWDTGWTTFPDEHQNSDPWTRRGGLGSGTYESQKCGEGAGFRRKGEGAIFHFDPDGDYVWKKLDYDKTGTSYWVDGYNSTRAGPKPGGEAEQLLGDGSYEWDEVNEWWTIK